MSDSTRGEEASAAVCDDLNKTDAGTGVCASVSYAYVLLDVANRRFDRVYTYLVPPDMPVAAGMTVLVPLQSRQVRGMVAYVSEVLSDDVSGVELRPILKILERDNVLPPELLALALWMSETVMCSIAQSLHAVWPFWRHKVEKWAVPLVSLDEVKDWRVSDPDGFLAMKILLRARRGGLPLDVFCARMGENGLPAAADGTAGDVRQLAERLAGLGVLCWDVRVTGVSGKKKQPGNHERADIEENAVAEENVVAKGSATEENVVAEVSAAEESPAAAGQEVTGESATAHCPLSTVHCQLSIAQKEVVQRVLFALDRGKGETVLLHGVTGSGKTLAYRALVAEVVARGRDAIVLVPEISLTSQVAGYFLADLGEKAAVVHSKLSSQEKQKIWADILAGKVKVVIGARSAVFAPLASLGIVIMDEEHDNAYQQDENPKYHTREVARRRVRHNGGVLVLGSATPSLESYAAARAGKTVLAELAERVSKRPLPRVEVVDMARELARGNKSIFSQALTRRLEARLARGEQSILFLNRRGYATYVFCRECGYVAKCPHCDVAMTYHSHEQILLCHYCDYRGTVDHRCPECGSIYLRFFGQGTQRLEEEIAACFPAARVLRLDTDAAQRQGQSALIVETFRRREADILVGTQMLAKGLDFPGVTLVGVVLADPLLNMPDFRARERAFQLLTQVAGRAGRHERPGEVVLQTYMPKDAVLRHVTDHDYRRFFLDEIAFRHGAGYPPFTHFIRLTVMHENEERVIRAAQELREQLALRTMDNGQWTMDKGQGTMDNGQWTMRRQGHGTMDNEETGARDNEETGGSGAAQAVQPALAGRVGDDLVQVLGPAPAVLSKLRNSFRWQILVKGKQLPLLRKVVHGGLERFYGLGAVSGVDVSVEVNPLR
ncbi:MAG: primosomal protein N' [Peptococcaceae bacterium]|nr:primosomal protein N' [Peptococcaceae bacterium]